MDPREFRIENYVKVLHHNLYISDESWTVFHW